MAARSSGAGSSRVPKRRSSRGAGTFRGCVRRAASTGRSTMSSCRLAAVYAAESAREAMDLMFQHGGSTSYRCESRLAECWRDLHVVGQAVTLAPEWYPMGGRVFLKMDPGPRLR